MAPQHQNGGSTTATFLYNNNQQSFTKYHSQNTLSNNDNRNPYNNSNKNNDNSNRLHSNNANIPSQIQQLPLLLTIQQ